MPVSHYTPIQETPNDASPGRSDHPTSPVKSRNDPIPSPRVHIPSDSNVVISPAGIIHVLGYTPSEGEQGAIISVRIHFQPEMTDAVYVRLVIGHRAVATTVREIKNAVYGRWLLGAVVPPLDNNQSVTDLLSVQALNDENVILDSTTFGEFFYWDQAGPLSSLTPLPNSPLYEHNVERQKPKLQIQTAFGSPEGCGFQQRRNTHLPTPPPTSPVQGHNSRALKPQIHLHRRTKGDTPTRSQHQVTGRHPVDIHAQTPVLDLITPLGNLCVDWSAVELNAGRRLVRFSKVQDGRRLIVSCEPIKFEDYQESDSVISCIYREKVDTCYVTSVDVIYLLERLTDSDFPVEEKNRIRRNLEGLRPITVSKHKPGFEDFFQRIMDFSDPKPRNIEKDLKVFEWTLLDQALDKILSKYTIDATYVDKVDSPVDSSPSSGSEENSDHSDFRSTPVKTEDLYCDPMSLPPKFEPLLAEDFYVSNSPDGSGSYSPDPLPSLTYPPYNSELVQSQTGGLSWGLEYKPSEAGIDEYSSLATFETIHPGAPLNNYADFAFNPYDALALHPSPDDLAGMTGQYI